MSTGHLKKRHMVHKGVGHWGLSWEVAATPGEGIWCISVPVYIFVLQTEGCAFPAQKGLCDPV